MGESAYCATSLPAFGGVTVLGCGASHRCEVLFHWAFFFFFFVGPPLWHMDVPRLGAELEPQLPAYATATAMWDPS